MNGRIKNPTIILVLVSMLLGSFAVVAVQPAKASNVTETLYGNAMMGWGFTPGGETIPGPTVTVNQNDFVTLYLYSDDGVPHQFLLDYNGNGMADTGEPLSAIFSTSTVLTFTASNSGVFQYKCLFHPGYMYGTWNTSAPPPPPTVHDVAVTSVSAIPLTVVKGGNVTISAVAANLGNVADTTTVTAYAGSIVVGSQPVTLQPGTNVTLTFTWNTGSVAIGNYTVSAQASIVTGETNTANNQMTDGTVAVTLPPPGNLIATFVGHEAWPDFHHESELHKGATQTLFAKIANIGPGPVLAEASFNVYDANGNLVYSGASNAVIIPVGGVTEVSWSYTTITGDFTATARCLYDSNNDGVLDGLSPIMKTFSFKVVR